MRAKSKRSSTRELMRIDSFSIRPSNSLVATSPCTAPWRCNSAKPRIAVSGVRNSWLASATKRRRRFSLVVRALNASSILVSIWLRLETNFPTSVLGFAIGIRADKSPAAIACAVSSTATSGRRPRSITFREANPMIRSAIKPIRMKKNCNFCVT